jgi:hypothetical protein
MPESDSLIYLSTMSPSMAFVENSSQMCQAGNKVTSPKQPFSFLPQKSADHLQMTTQFTEKFLRRTPTHKRVTVVRFSS